MAHVEVEHRDAAALAEAVARRIAEALEAALAEDGTAALALAGGRTAPPIFRALAAEPREWSRVALVPTDERWVDAEHVDSNLRALREGFAPAIGVHFLALTPEFPSGPADAHHAVQALCTIPGPFAATLLGMGADGHFASLFPGARNLAEGLDPLGAADAIAVVPDPMPSAGPHERISLTLPRLLRSRRVLLAITGADKLAVLRRAAREGAASGLPVAALLHAAGQEIEVHWSGAVA